MAIITKYKDGTERIHFPSTDKFFCGTDEFDDTTTYSTITKIKASDPAAQSFFGASTAIGNGRIVVGCSYDSNGSSYSGAAYIFDLNGTQIAKIKAFDAAASDYFGSHVAVGCNRIVVSSYGDDDNGSASGSIYIFDLDGNFLKKVASPTNANNQTFGWSVAVGSGRIVVGAYGDVGDQGAISGAAYIFDLNGNLIKKLKPDDLKKYDYFGYSVAVGSGRIVVGAYGVNDDPNTELIYDSNYEGRVYIFDLDGTQIAKISPPTQAPEGTINLPILSFYNYYGGGFGWSVDVGCNRIIVGAPYVDLMEPDDNTVTKELNRGVAEIFDLDGNHLKTIEPFNRPSNKVYKYPTGETTYENVDTRFGNKVAVADGRFYVCSQGIFGIFFSAFDGVLYTYDLEGNELWNYDPNTERNNFGQSLAAGDGLVAVGSIYDGYVYDPTNYVYQQDYTTAYGAAYVFDGQPKQTHFLDFIDEIKI